MCGIAGFIDYSKSWGKDDLNRMHDSIYHRGPDSSGQMLMNLDNYAVGFGHQRLSILDLSINGHQPMKFENILLTYNGEVYNFTEIKEELLSLGYQFNSTSDTEVILKGYHKWGLEIVNRLNGMFAIAIYDRSLEKLFLIRDRMGIKPLYYGNLYGNFLFGSELKSILALLKKEQKPGLSATSIQYFFQQGFVPAPHSMFEGIYKLPQGCILEFNIRDKRQTIRNYYNDQSTEKITDYVLAKSQLKGLIEDSVIKRLVADVEVGVFLSGGVDSTLVASVARKYKRDLKSISIGFKDTKYSETSISKKTAEKLGLKHKEFVYEDDFINDLQSHLDFFDEPLADNSIFPTMFLSQITKNNGVTVALSGDGGDELFFGYTSLNKANTNYSTFSSQFSRKLGAFITLPEISFTNQIFGSNLSYKYNKIKSLSRSTSFVDYMRNMTSYYPDTIAKQLLNQYEMLESELSSDIVTAYEYYKQVILADQLLVKTDRSSMMHGLEVRTPLLDHRIVSLSRQLPREFMYDKGSGKIILKEVLKDYFPEYNFNLPKRGFTFPYWNAFYTSVVQEFIINQLNYLENLNLPYFRKCHLVEVKKNFIEKKDSKYILRLLIFSLWYQKWIDNGE